MKDLSKYPGLLRMCGYCTQKRKKEEPCDPPYYCEITHRYVYSTTAAMDCKYFDGENVSLPNINDELSQILFE